MGFLHTMFGLEQKSNLVILLYVDKELASNHSDSLSGKLINLKLVMIDWLFFIFFDFFFRVETFDQHHFFISSF